MAEPRPPMLDVIIIGAGVAGINAAYRVQTQAPSGTTYAIFEARDSIGGTWDLFRYPGIRSDSDMFTYGFSWRPWPKSSTLGAGRDIKEYIEQSAKEAGIDKQIYRHRKVKSANWNQDDGCWELSVLKGNQEKPAIYRSQFIFLGTGYYDYDQPLRARIPGIQNFRGRVIHPQFWPESDDCTGKEVVVIGSGATAVTIVPSIADQVKHVSMLQRSPSYILPIAKNDMVASLVSTLLPGFLAKRLNRLVAIVHSYLFFWACRAFPNMAKKFISRKNSQLLPPEVAWDPHFKPRYNPWDQRLCMAQDGDFFAALRSGKASIVTDTIQTVTDRDIKLASGHVLQPDVIVTATGLKLKFAGGIDFSVNDKPYDLTQKFAWKASMLQDLPNMVFSIGYENASWTLGVDCAAQLLARVMGEVWKNKARLAVPSMTNPEKMRPRSIMSLSSTYIKANSKNLPKAGTGNWGPRTNYVADLYGAKWGNDAGLSLK